MRAPGHRARHPAAPADTPVSTRASSRRPRPASIRLATVLRRRWLQLTGSPAFELPPAGCAAGRSISRSCGTAPTGTGAHWGDHLHPVDDLRSRASSSASQTAQSLSRNSSISPTPWPAGWAIHPRHPRPAGRRCRLRPVQCEGVRPSRRPGVAPRRPGHRGSTDRLVRCRAVAHWWGRRGTSSWMPMTGGIVIKESDEVGGSC